MIQSIIQFFVPHAHAYTYFDLGDAASSTLAYAGSIVSDLSPVWKLVLGVLLGVAVISWILKSLHK